MSDWSRRGGSEPAAHRIEHYVSEFRPHVGAVHHPRRERVMQVADRAALVDVVHHQHGRGKERRFDLLLVVIVRPDGRDSSSAAATTWTPPPDTCRPRTPLAPARPSARRRKAFSTASTQASTSSSASTSGRVSRRVVGGKGPSLTGGPWNDTVESMNDASGIPTPERASGRRWLLLITQLPPKPDYLRVKVRRRLRRLGAVPIKQTVYVLPHSDESLEDFQWLRQEIERDGGSAIIAEAALVEGISDEELDAMFATERGEDADSGRAAPAHAVEPGRTWVTREGVHVDRMASAWLIRRFIDPDARIKFVPARGYRPRPRELRFDMVDAEYTHVGEDCTFQTLVARFGLRDRGLTAIGEVVHDIDCKDERFGRAETAGIAGVIRGIAVAQPDDDARLERGAAIFDDLYAYFRARRSPTP